MWWIKKAFTLIEIMIGITIVASVVISWFYALTSINVGKIKLIEETTIEKEAFYFSEKLFEFIKRGGLIDYEEYFNRSNVNATSFINGHYSTLSWFWNKSNQFYYCISGNGTSMGIWGCMVNSYNNLWVILTTRPFLFWEYAYQFIDYNSNADEDWGDEDWNLSPLEDDDDEYLWLWPDAFSSTNSVQELYLINSDKTKRTFLRWNVSVDPKKPIAETCTGLAGDPKSIAWEGCLGKIEFLKLEWVDWWNDHNENTWDNTEYDGIIDTWLFDRDVYGLTKKIVADENPLADWENHNSENYWVSLFPNTINVKKINLFLYPSKDISFAWKDVNSSVNIAPYLRINLSLSPSWERRVAIKWQPVEFNFSTTLSLSDVFIK